MKIVGTRLEMISRSHSLHTHVYLSPIKKGQVRLSGRRIFAQCWFDVEVKHEIV